MCIHFQNLHQLPKRNASKIGRKENWNPNSHTQLKKKKEKLCASNKEEAMVNVTTFKNLQNELKSSQKNKKRVGGGWVGELLKKLKV